MVLDEIAIKRALIDWIWDQGMLRNAVLANEMVVASWAHRADLVVVNGRLSAFEIKSDLDTLKRLKGQVSAYRDHFDKVYVVTTDKYLGQVIDVVPDDIEILRVSVEDGTPRIKTAKRGRIIENRSHAKLCGFLLKHELVQLLKAAEIEASKDTSRRELERLVGDVPIARMRSFVLERLKFRYAKPFASFSKARGEFATAEGDLKYLSRFGRREHIVQPQNVLPPKEDQPTKRLDWKGIFARWGNVEATLPDFVRVRAFTS